MNEFIEGRDLVLKNHRTMLRSWGFCAIVLLFTGALPTLGADVPGAVAPPDVASSAGSASVSGSSVSHLLPLDPAASFGVSRPVRFLPVPMRKTPLYIDPATDYPEGGSAVPASPTTPPPFLGGTIGLFLKWFLLG